MIEFKFPKTLNGWAILVAVFGYCFNLFVKIINFLFINRGSSNETKKEFERMKDENKKEFESIEKNQEKNHQEIKNSITELREFFEISISKLASKELLENKIENISEKFKSEIKIGLIKMQNMANIAINNANRQTDKAQGMKTQLRNYYSSILERLDNLDGKKDISNKINSILNE